jgi:hypothetical protein
MPPPRASSRILERRSTWRWGRHIAWRFPTRTPAGHDHLHDRFRVTGSQYPLGVGLYGRRRSHLRRQQLGLRRGQQRRRPACDWRHGHGNVRSPATANSLFQVVYGSNLNTAPAGTGLNCDCTTLGTNFYAIGGSCEFFSPNSPQSCPFDKTAGHCLGQTASATTTVASKFIGTVAGGSSIAGDLGPVTGWHCYPGTAGIAYQCWAMCLETTSL